MLVFVPSCRNRRRPQAPPGERGGSGGRLGALGEEGTSCRNTRVLRFPLCPWCWPAERNLPGGSNYPRRELPSSAASWAQPAVEVGYNLFLLQNGHSFYEAAPKVLRFCLWGRPKKCLWVQNGPHAERQILLASDGSATYGSWLRTRAGVQEVLRNAPRRRNNLSPAGRKANSIPCWTRGGPCGRRVERNPAVGILGRGCARDPILLAGR